jgi:hypothetical protein
MITAALGLLSTAFLFWSATVAGEWRSAVVGLVGFAFLVAAMITANAGLPSGSGRAEPAMLSDPAGCVAAIRLNA